MNEDSTILRPVADTEIRNGQHFVTARAEPTPWDRFILFDGSKLVEDVRIAKVLNDQGEKIERPMATLASRSRNGGINRKQLDISFLKGASEAYKISADIRDYIFVSLPIVTAGIPNRNMDCFTYNELATFSPIHGRFTYETFKHVPVHKNHVNQDPTKAKGVHFDATLRKYSVRPGDIGYSSGTDSVDLWKVRILTGWCRQKDEHMVKQILRKEITGYSMGALIDYALCSVCKNVTTPKPCMHVAAGKGKLTRDGYVVYDNVHGVNFIETSGLEEEPADYDAFSSDVWSSGMEMGKL